MSYTFSKTPFKKASIVKKASPSGETLSKLRSFLDVEEPKLVYFLVNLWKAQGRAITYKELREAILAGEISAELLEEWRQDYSKFVTDHLQPKWIKAMDDAAKEIHEKYPEWYFDPMHDGVASWTENRAAEFVTSCTDTQIEGLRAVVQQAAVMETMNVDLLARAIRPMVGLYYQQSIANLNYFNTLIASGTNTTKALDLAIRYAARQHRYRGYLIARTELAFAYNKGAQEGVKQAQEAGYMGEVVKIWVTAADERVCDICGPLDGKVIALDDNFDFKTKLSARYPTICQTPPAHPNCRCAIMYEEISPPDKQKRG